MEMQKHVCVGGGFKRVSFAITHIMKGVIARSRENPISVLFYPEAIQMGSEG